MILYYHAESDCLFVEQYQYIDLSMVTHCDDVSSQPWAVERYNREVPGYPVHLYEDREDGLGNCLVCGGAECSMPTDCPGERITPDQADAICDGTTDYWSGVWL